MQGEGVGQSIIAALDEIFTAAGEDDAFDCVVIIRGGGATADLSGFDTLALAENVANFPIPVITGIGHDRDESILDMVSHTHVKTPTAAAAFLVDHLLQVHNAINDCQERMLRLVQQRMSVQHAQLSVLQETITRLFSVVRVRQEARLDALYGRLTAAVTQTTLAEKAKIDAFEQRIPLLLFRTVADRKHRLELLEEKAKSLDPALLLRRGYSITLKDGHALRDASLLRPGDEIETRLEKGIIKSTVI